MFEPVAQRFSTVGCQTVKKNMSRLLFALCVLALLTCSSCSKDEPEVVYHHWMVTKVESAGTTSVAAPLILEVSWPYRSGCDVMDRFEVTAGLSTTVLTIKSMGYTTTGACTDDAGIKKTNYSFTATKPGTYTLNFENPDGSVVEHVVVVN